jgi:coproporphyrinogen III oxidase
MTPGVEGPRAYLLDLQDHLCATVEAVEGETGSAPARFDRREHTGDGGSLARPCVLSDGRVFERAAVNFTHAGGPSMPAAGTERRPDLAGLPFAAVSLSLIFHPRNPYAPITHMNLRFFAVGAKHGGPAGSGTAGKGGEGATATAGAGPPPVWWFGGGFDLTPCYGFEEDAVFWHRMARRACARFGDDVYPELKASCDAYFFLPHRGECRGVGGLFFDDRTGNFEREFGLWKSLGDHFPLAYFPILDRRKDAAYGERERRHQEIRRGRYVEFNLLYDRGTRYGLQSGRNIESVMASMPPAVRWAYDHEPEPGTPEAELAERFLKPRDWLGGE